MTRHRNDFKRVVFAAACLGAIGGPSGIVDARDLRFAGSPLQVWNVAEQGSHKAGDDITATLQKGLDTQREHGLPVYIPHGWWKISKTIVTPFTTSCVIHTAGVSDSAGPPQFEQGHYASGIRTRLVWVGEKGGVILKATGANVQIRGGLSLHGKPHKSSSTDTAGVGLMITKNGGNNMIGTGRHYYDPMIIEDCDVAVQAGQTVGEANCEGLYFDHLNFRRCKIGYLSINAMAMTVGMEFATGFAVERAFVFEGGGLLHVDNSVWHQTTLLTIRENRDTPRKGAATGNGNGYFCFRNCKVDGGSLAKFTALDVETPANIHCVIDGGILEYPNFTKEGGTFAKLKGRSAFTVRDFRGPLGKITGEAHKYSGVRTTPNVLIDRTQLWGPIDWQGELDYRVRDCFDARGNFLEDQTSGEGQLTSGI